MAGALCAAGRATRAPVSTGNAGLLASAATGPATGIWSALVRREQHARCGISHERAASRRKRAPGRRPSWRFSGHSEFTSLAFPLNLALELCASEQACWPVILTEFKQ